MSKMTRTIVSQAGIGSAVSLLGTLFSIDSLVLIVLVIIFLEILESTLTYYLTKLYKSLQVSKSNHQHLSTYSNKS